MCSLQENQNSKKISQIRLYSQSKNFGPSPTLKLEPMGLISLESSTQGTSNLKNLDIALKSMDISFLEYFLDPKPTGKTLNLDMMIGLKNPNPTSIGKFSCHSSMNNESQRLFSGWYCGCWVCPPSSTIHWDP